MLWLALWVTAFATVAPQLVEVPAERPAALPSAIAPSEQVWSAVATPTAVGPQGGWYGAPIAIVDSLDAAAAWSLIAYANHSQKPWGGTVPALGALLVVYLFDGAVVHGLHHRPDRGGRSVLLRVGAFLTGAIVGVALVSHQTGCGSDMPSPDCSDLAYAVTVPALVAMGIDDWFFARDPVVAPEPRSTALAPRLIVKPGLALMGLGGTF